MQNKKPYDIDSIDIDADYQDDIATDIDDFSNDFADDFDDWYPEADEFFRQYRAEQRIFDY